MEEISKCPRIFSESVVPANKKKNMVAKLCNKAS
jgi:hypothetical protein